MLDFTFSFVEGDRGSASAKFLFKNNSDKTIHCLSYKFTSSKDKAVIADFNPHQFLFDIKPDEEKEKIFGMTNIGESYLGGNTNPGRYDVNVLIKYFICGESKLELASSETVFEIRNE